MSITWLQVGNLYIASRQNLVNFCRALNINNFVGDTTCVNLRAHIMPDLNKHRGAAL